MVLSSSVSRLSFLGHRGKRAPPIHVQDLEPHTPPPPQAGGQTRPPSSTQANTDSHYCLSRHSSTTLGTTVTSIFNWLEYRLDVPSQPPTRCYRRLSTLHKHPLATSRHRPSQQRPLHRLPHRPTTSYDYITSLSLSLSSVFRAPLGHDDRRRTLFGALSKCIKGFCRCPATNL